MNLENKTTYIFDMDGLLVDSERLHIHFWKQVLPGDPAMIDELLHHTIGTSGEMAREIVKKYTGDAHFLDRYSEEKEKMTHEYILKNGLPRKDGALELCQYLSALSRHLILVSSTNQEGVDFSLRQAGLTDYFSDRVCGDQIRKTKPAPDIYLKALRDYQLNADACVVFEDSINGIKAADAAGIDVVGIPDLVDISGMSLPHLIGIEHSLKDVLEILKEEK